MKINNYYKLIFKKIVIIFLISSFLGACYEEVLNFIINKTWVSRQTVLYGPFNPVYGFGIILLIALLSKKKNKNFFRLWLYSSIIGGLFEYSYGFIVHLLFGICFWDYSNYFLNLNGYTTIPYIIGWGFLGAILIKYIYPWLNPKLEKMTSKLNNILFILITILLFLDLLITFLTLTRLNLRKYNIKPLTSIGKLIDKVYPEKVIIKHIPLIKSKN